MELTVELVSAIAGGVTAIGAGVAKMIHWAVSVGREEAAATRTAHKEATLGIVEAQKERDEAERVLQRERDAATEARYQAMAAEGSRNRDAFLEGLDRIREAYETRKAG